MLEKLKNRLNITVDDRDLLLENIIEDATNLILLYLNLDYIEDEKLETIIILISTELFNGLGKEGIISQNTSGLSQTYKNNILASYQSFLDEYKKNDEREVLFF